MATLQVESRIQASSAEVNRLRSAGVMPMALITKKEGTRLIQAPVADLKEVISQTKGLIMFDLEEGKNKMRVVMKGVQRHPSTRKVLHMTVQEVLDTDTIKVAIPITITGEPVAVTKRAATLIVPMNQLEVQAVVSKLPDSIVVDVSELGQNDKVVVGDIKLPDGVNALSSPEAVVASTKQLRGMSDIEDGAAEEGAEGDSAEGEATEGGEASAEESAE